MTVLHEKIHILHDKTDCVTQLNECLHEKHSNAYMLPFKAYIDQ